MARYSGEAPVHLRKEGWGAGLGGRRRDSEDSQGICISCLIKGKRQLPPSEHGMVAKHPSPNIRQRDGGSDPHPTTPSSATNLFNSHSTNTPSKWIFPYHEKNTSTPRVSFRLTGEISEASPLKSGRRQDCLTILKMVLEVLANTIGQEKEVRHKNWKERDEIIIVCKWHHRTPKRIS